MGSDLPDIIEPSGLPRVGRYAPSPSGPLHVGNLRTAVLAWLWSTVEQHAMLLRIEDLDPARSRLEHEQAQLRDLGSLGITWPSGILRQSERAARYDAAIEQLRDGGLIYPCYCTRAEIRAAASAPHGDELAGAYPGTCRALDQQQVEDLHASGRQPCLRLRVEPGTRLGYVDEVLGTIERPIDDVIVRRADGVAAYNLAVVVDDADSGVGLVVRGDDLATSTPRQLLLQRLLGLPHPAYAHVPLVLGPDDARLAKRHGSVTLADQRAAGRTPGDVLAWIATSIGISDPGMPSGVGDLAARWRPDLLPREPVRWGLDDEPV